MLTAIRADKLFDGLADQPLTARTVVVRDGRIEAVAAGDPALPSDACLLKTPLLVPGFVDMQINGAADVLFNDEPMVRAIAAIAAGARTGGTACLLPTFITAGGQAYLQAIAAADQALEAGVPGVLGIHLEGPFLSPARPGIHDTDAIRPVQPEDLEALVEAQAGVRLITLAPEEQPSGVIEKLVRAGWTVFAGHSDAGFEVMRRAASEGLAGVTHLFNAMRQIGPREPGLVGSVLDDERLFAGIIADGHHVHPANLRLAVSRLGSERLCLVTDAMPTLGGRSPSFKLAGKTIRLDQCRLTDAEGRLAGAHLSMAEAVRNLVELAGTPLPDALRMASTTPAKALGLGDRLGRIAPGYQAALTFLDDRLCSNGVFVDGHWLPNEATRDA